MHFGAEKIDLKTVQFSPELLRCIPAHVARHYRALPVATSSKSLCIAVADASDIDVTDSLSHILRRDFDLRVADRAQLEEFIQRLYGEAKQTG